MKGAGGAVEKLMSCTRQEFETGVARLTGAPPVRTPGGEYLLAVPEAPGSTVLCSFEPQPEAVLGKLLHLPRVRVRLSLDTLPEPAAEAFLHHFDRVFQRGGG